MITGTQDTAEMSARILKIEDEQRARMKTMFDARPKTPATADFDLPAAGEWSEWRTKCDQARADGDLSEQYPRVTPEMRAELDRIKREQEEREESLSEMRDQLLDVGLSKNLHYFMFSSYACGDYGTSDIYFCDHPVTKQEWGAHYAAYMAEMRRHRAPVDDEPRLEWIKAGGPQKLREWENKNNPEESFKKLHNMKELYVLELWHDGI